MCHTGVIKPLPSDSAHFYLAYHRSSEPSDRCVGVSQWSFKILHPMGYTSRAAIVDTYSCGISIEFCRSCLFYVGGFCFHWNHFQASQPCSVERLVIFIICYDVDLSSLTQYSSNLCLGSLHYRGPSFYHPCQCIWPLIIDSEWPCQCLWPLGIGLCLSTASVCNGFGVEDLW